MPFTLTMPKLSPTMEVGTIAKWRKKVGDLVKPGDVIFEVTTDKATVEHGALDEGYLRKIIVNEGQEAAVNQAVAIFTESKDESIEGYQPTGTAAKKAEEPKKKEDEKVEEAPVSAPKATGAMQQPAFVPQPPLSHYDFPFPEGTPSRVAASPLAKRLAKEKGVDLSSVKGTGPHGRIMSRDLEMATPGGPVSFGERDIPTEIPGSYEEIPLSPIRKVIAQRLQESKTFIPHFYVTQEIYATPMVEAREQLKKNGINISFNDFVVRACALTLREHPHVNSGFNSVNSTIIRFKTIDISIAVSLESGLITPIVRHADYKNLGQLSAEIKALAKRARDGKLQREEYFGGSFTVSNLGMFGITAFSGVINPPQAALLAVGGIEDKAVVRDGKLIAGKTMTVTLSADHRVVDGADGARFIKTLQQFLENPAILLI